MTKLEKLMQEIEDEDIKIINYPFDEITAAAININDKKRIILDKSKIKNKTHERTILAHEFFHFKTGTLYYLNECKISIAKKEYKCNKHMIQELVPIDDLKMLLSLNYYKDEIALFFDVEEETVDLALDIYKWMGVL